MLCDRLVKIARSVADTGRDEVCNDRRLIALAALVCKQGHLLSLTGDALAAHLLPGPLAQASVAQSSIKELKNQSIKN